MPRSERVYTHIKDDRQRQILSAALKVFIHQGFVSSRMSDISREAGISYGLVYHYFRSKEEVYLELVRGATEIASRFVEDLEAAEMEPVEKLRTLVEHVFRGIDRNETAGYGLVFMIQAMASGAYPVHAVMEAHDSKRTFDALVRIMRDGQEKGQVIPGDPSKLVLVFFSAVLGLACLRVAGVMEVMPDPEVLIRIFRPAAPMPEGTGRYHA